MWIVTPRDVGRIEYGRMVRDGVIEPVLPGHATPADVPAAPAIRRAILATMVPAGGQATGLAALWALGVGSAPQWIDVRHDANRRLGTRRGSVPVRGHAVGLAPPAVLASASHPTLASAPVAAADALRWTPGAAAQRAIAHAVRDGLLEPRQIEAA